MNLSIWNHKKLHDFNTNCNSNKCEKVKVGPAHAIEP